MGILIITDLTQNRQQLESGMLEQGFLDFNSISIEDNYTLWQSKFQIDLLILFLSQTDNEKLSRIISSFDPSTKILLTSENRFPQHANVYNLKGENYSGEIIDFIKSYSPPAKLIKEDILIRINDKYKRVRSLDIEYLQADGKYVTVNLGDRSYSLRTSLKAMQMILPKEFVRTHASFIVNIDKVESIHIQEQNVELSNGHIPYSRKYKSNIFDRFFLG